MVMQNEEKKCLGRLVEREQRNLILLPRCVILYLQIILLPLISLWNSCNLISL